RVVALDMDLEAPGLHFKLNIGSPGKRTADEVPERGAVDYLLAAADADRPPRNLLDYLVPVPLPGGAEGSLHLMPAGSAPTGQYWKALTTLLGRNFFNDPEGSGLAACLELKARIAEELKADFLLIDARTGVTELAGVTTTVLADKVVCLMLANRESQSGARAVLRSLRHAARLPGQEAIEVIPVLSRVPERDYLMAQETLSFLNEPGPTPEETLALKRVFMLRADPELAHSERLYVGSGEPEVQSSLHQDYLALLAKLFEPDLIAALRALPERDRRTLELMYFHGLTYEETAVVLGISVSTLKMRAVRARRRLRKLLAEEGEEAPPSARMHPSRP
ncbi:MAG TPA: sigma factor-like helix-turn-helix DNA-binding protein, partial [Thermoanaerobaculia bacterium]|nr:sigma factor-like helix-turn-helix DNA-binding protein [Thermoanaerobaculia bacterium]